MTLRPCKFLEMLKTLYLKKIYLKEEVVENIFCPYLGYFFHEMSQCHGCIWCSSYILVFATLMFKIK